MTARRVEASPAEQLERDRSLSFTFDGRSHRGLAGDTIGSALAAAGIEVLSRSFKYHRPRGLLCCAGRCPNCLVEVDGRPNVRACTVPVRDGMRVRSQNAWPSRRWDLMALTGWFDRFLPIGFYYKTFIRPRSLWPLYERVLRHAAGLGRVDPASRPELHARKRHVHADVVVIGGGPAGCLAALEAAAAGSRVVLVDDGDRLGGRLRHRSRPVTGDPRLGSPSGFEAASRLAALVAAEPRIEHLSRATAIGIYEGRLVAVLQDTLLLRIRAGAIVVATGAAEHPAVFGSNDLPGIMLASGILRLRHDHGVAAGRRVVVVTDDDHGWLAAAELLAGGFDVAALVDAREPRPHRPAAAELDAAGVTVHHGATPLEARGRRRVERLAIRTEAADDVIACDLVALAMRPEPVIALLAGAGATTRYDDGLGEWLPDRLPEGVHAAGRVLGLRADDEIAASGVRAGLAATGADVDAVAVPSPSDPAPEVTIGTGRKQFVCLCEDVTVKELRQGVQEGFDSLETLKRYSTVTMGPCQGKQCHGLAARIHARAAGGTPAATGLTTSRPPFQPVPLAVLAGPHLSPVRRTAMHDRHDALGARWIDMGDWKRPFAYGSVDDEVRAVRETAGLIDVSTLGKLDVQGRDAAAFLDWLHPNRFSDVRVGRVRYRAMLDDAGIILDDGTVARLGDTRFLVSTTTGNLDAVEQWFGWWLAGGPRDVDVTNVTSQLAAVNLAGPRAREVLARVTTLDVSREAMPYLAAAEGDVAGVPAVLLRIGFVGEVGFEIHVPADYGAHVWDALLEAGADVGIRPFGVEAQRVLRLEKQHAIVGQDTDALSMPEAAGMGWTLKHDKDDFIGRAATRTAATGGQVLTGFEIDGDEVPAEGSAIVRGEAPIGRVTSAKWSPTLGRPIGLCWLNEPSVREGEEIRIRLGVGTDGRSVAGRVRTTPFYDPAGERLRA